MRDMGRVVVAGMLWVSAAGAAHGQTIRGVVIETGTRAPVVTAEVVVLDGTAREVGRTLTDSLGAFRVGVSREGRYTLRVAHAAYVSYESDAVNVGPAETVTLEVRLGQAVVPLDPLVVTARSSTRLAEFHQRRATNAFGRYITREDIERRASPRTTDLLRGMAGVTILPVQVRGRTSNLIAMRGAMGRCDPAIYIDGLLVRQHPQSTMDDILQPDVLAGVEIYTSTAGAPIQFADPTGCGSVLFWTRSGEDREGRRFSWLRAGLGLGTAVLLILLIR